MAFPIAALSARPERFAARVVFVWLTLFLLLTGRALGGTTMVPIRAVLETRSPHEDTIAGGQPAHAYQVELEEGQFLDLMVDQRGVDVVVDVLSPSGDRITRVDSPNHEHGPEEVAIAAAATGTYTVLVQAAREDAPPGQYSIEIRDRRPASKNDKGHATARLAFDAAEELRRGGSYREALAGYEAALKPWQVIKDKRWLAEAHSRLGEINSLLGEVQAALDHQRKAHYFFEQVGRPLQAAQVANALSASYRSVGAIPEAISRAEQALEIFRETPGPASQQKPLEAAALLNLGFALMRTDDLDGAITRLAEAQSVALETSDRQRQARALHGMALVLLLQGKLQESGSLFDQALVLRRKIGRATDTASTLVRLGDLYFRLGELDIARGHVEEALGIYRNLGTGRARSTGMALNALGNILFRKGEVTAAIATFEEALPLVRERGSGRDLAMTLLHLGRARAAAGQEDEAVDLYHDALSRFQALGDPRAEASASYGCALVKHARGDLTGAHLHLEAAIERVESARVETARYDLRTAYFASKQDYYDLLIDTLMRLDSLEESNATGYAARALEVSERRRARTLLDSLRDQKAELRSGTNPDLLEQEAKIQKRLNELERSALALADAGLGSNHRHRRRIATARTKALLDLEETRARIRRESPRYAELTKPRPLSAPEMQNLLDPETAMLVFAVGADESFVWTITEKEITAHRGLPGRDQIASEVDHLRRLLQTGADPLSGNENDPFRKLSHTYLGPSVPALRSTRRMVLVPDGALALLPFGALPDPTTGVEEPLDLLIARRQVIYLPSTGTLSSSRRHRDRRLTPGNRRLAIVADPVFSRADERLGATADTSLKESDRFPLTGDLQRAAADVGLEFERLPNTRKELEVLRALVPESHRFEAVDFAATPQNLLKPGALAGYKLLHFATHGILNTRHPELSGLVLSLVDRQGEPAGGFLRTHEIFNLDLDAELVVLSACETGLGREARGEGVEGLMHAFFHAGVPQIVSSLWKVDDQSTAELMRRFYYYYMEGPKPLAASAALRCAQSSMALEPEWRSPYHWAGFVFYGDWQTRSTRTGDDPIEEQLAGDRDPITVETDLPDDDDRCPRPPHPNWPFGR